MKRNLLYEGIIDGIVTGEQKLRTSGQGTYELFFSVKPDEKIVGIPEELVVRLNRGYPYVRKGDRVKIDGKILEYDNDKSGYSIFVIKAKTVYNETLYYGFKMKKNILFEGIIDGIVTGEQKLRTSGQGTYEVFFSVKLDDKIAGLPEELVVRLNRGYPYVRKGDRVKIDGKIVEYDDVKSEYSSFIIKAKNMYNETLYYGI